MTKVSGPSDDSSMNSCLHKCKTLKVYHKLKNEPHQLQTISIAFKKQSDFIEIST